MKKLYVILFCLIIILSCSACGNSSDNQNNSGSAVGTESKADDVYGRGLRDDKINKTEPSYVGLIGYVGVYDTESMGKDGSYGNTPWYAKTYSKDKQFYEESGVIPHKTEVTVLEQDLTRSSSISYDGYLHIKINETGEETYINVEDFIVKPYWNYEDLEEAAADGDFIAEFNQVSDYYPVNIKGEKTVIEDGTQVIAVGKTGMYSHNTPNRNTNQIEAYVNMEVDGEEKPVRVFINVDDLKIVY